MTDGPDLLLRGSAWVSLGAWAYAEWLRAARGERSPAARAAFSAGLGAIAAHSLLAFAVRYAWSHEAALADAARQIEAVTGTASSDGFLWNYVFLSWWTLEALAWWIVPAGYARRPRALVWASRLVFAFMFANGAIVFARGPVRIFGAVAVLAAISAWVYEVAWRTRLRAHEMPG